MSDINWKIPPGYIKVSQAEMECDCICHTNPKIIHFMPCCYECPKCGKNIKGEWIEVHSKVCGTGREVIEKPDKMSG
jgi:hypothetical protein